MSPVHRSVLTSADAWSRLEPIIEEFEEAWLAGSQPDLEAFLSRDDSDRDTLLEELVLADLECRLKHGLPVQVETYVERFPQLAQAPKRLIELIATEFQLRRRSDPRVSADEYLGRFPQLRDELSARLSAVPPDAPRSPLECPGCHQPIPLSAGPLPRDFTCAACGQNFRLDPSHARPGLRSDQTQLGKFLLERVVGRGAFGTVYRARDPELDRIVAVKVPRAAWMDKTEEDRFFREARAAAQLSHPGIVPIFDVSRADGCPYLVSAFVEGRTLAELMTERRLGFRESATLLADVADAVAHAHERGVIHRDLKPSNIMLGRLDPGDGAPAPRDGERPFVMDFGLARRDEGEVRMTLDGEIVGTPAYMSPEQAGGHGHGADARSDTYSLGAIFYELLTGELPFGGTARMVLQQIQSDDPRPPRKLNDRIPRDLETITLKCLAKDPERRYATAAALTDDVHRYLDGRPILARPAGWFERVGGWTQRNPYKAAVLILLVLVAVGSAGAAFYIHGQRQIAVGARIEAEKSTAFALEQLDLNQETLRKLVFEVQDQLDGKTVLAGVRERLLLVAQDGLEKLAAAGREKPAQRGMISVHQRLGDIALALGKHDEARAQYRRAQDLAEILWPSDSDGESGRRNLGTNHMLLGNVSRTLGHHADAQDRYELALAAARTVAAQSPDRPEDSWFVVMVLLRLGDVHASRGDPAAAVKCFAEARDRARNLVGRLAGTAAEGPDLGRRVRLDLAFAHEKLAELALRGKDLTAARANSQQALEVADDLLALDPRSREARAAAAWAWERLGDVCLAEGNPAAAEELYRKALGQREELLKLDPFRSGNVHMYALAHARLGDAHARLSNPELARQYLEKAITRFEEYFGEVTRDARARTDLANAQNQLGQLLRRMGQPVEARELYVKVVQHREDVAGQDARGPGPQLNVVMGLANLGLADVDRLDFAAAEKSFTKALNILDTLEKAGTVRDRKQYESLVQFHKTRAAVCQEMTKAIADLEHVLTQPEALIPELLRGRARVLASRGEHKDAATTAEHYRKRVAKDAALLAEAGMIYALCAARAAEGAARAAYVKQALDTLTDAVKRGYRDFVSLSHHPDWEAVRRDERFQDLLGQVKEQLRTPR